MKQTIKRTIGLFVVIALVIGSTALLGMAVDATQENADKEIVVKSTVGYSNAETPVTTAAPYDPNPPTPRPQDISKETALDIAAKEILKVFEIDITGFEIDSEYFFSMPSSASWDITISNENSHFFCVVEAVTGQVSLIHYSDLTKSEEISGPSGESPLPGDNSYNEVAIAAMSNIDDSAAIADVQFSAEGFNKTEVVFWIDVRLENGSAYTVGITKQSHNFIGYTYHQDGI